MLKGRNENGKLFIAVADDVLESYLSDPTFTFNRNDVIVALSKSDCVANINMLLYRNPTRKYHLMESSAIISFRPVVSELSADSVNSDMSRTSSSDEQNITSKQRHNNKNAGIRDNRRQENAAIASSVRNSEEAEPNPLSDYNIDITEDDLNIDEELRGSSATGTSG